MALKYNRSTAVDQDFKIANKSNSTYYSDANIQQLDQNELVSYTAYTSINEVQTVTEDFIATQCLLSVRCGDNGSTGFASISISIGSRDLTGTLSVESQPGESRSDSVVIALPNISIKENEIITFNVSTNDGAVSGSVIGYKI